ncbi:hypothetical protein [Chryseobacterium indologenes]|uniref:Uncharacterized protein n=1 Tax=Chryseobacterium indologenes TaxID=253 RepID=A0A0N0IVR2_CHRID|nr:hypothetical protein [Chryseobacterium indologenes]KPE50753.1 hypothetical protein AOB46_13260 [Chryseobacterium indologenes]
MNKKFILLVFLEGIFLPKAQVGINNSSPAATLDVTSKTTGTTAGTPEGLIAPRLTLLDLNQKSSAYTAAQTGTLIYVTNASNASPSGKTVNIITTGYYYFDGSVWQRIINNSNNIYTSDGTLAGNRTVTQGANTLSFNSTATTGTSHFNVDGSTFSVDAVNNRVGITVTAPLATLDVAGEPANTSRFDGIIPPRITGAQLRAKTYTASHAGTIVYATAADTAPSGQTVNVTSPGSYYFDGTVWVQLQAISQTAGSKVFKTPLQSQSNVPVLNVGDFEFRVTTGNVIQIRFTGTGSRAYNSFVTEHWSSNGYFVASSSGTANGTFANIAGSTVIGQVNELNIIRIYDPVTDKMYRYEMNLISVSGNNELSQVVEVF